MILSRLLRSMPTRHPIAIVGSAVVLALVHETRANPDLVDIKSVSPSIVVDLRYATPNNVAGRPLYPAGMRACVVPSVAQQLARAERFLRDNYTCGLKIWDAYRPRVAQQVLWQVAHNGDFITNPESGIGSLHSWGVAVDATLVDNLGREMSMPTRFDEFTPQAAMHYQGTDPAVQTHLRLLQVAMGGSNFWGLRIEWWHFVTADWKKFVPENTSQTATTEHTVGKTLNAVSQKPQNSKG